MTGPPRRGDRLRAQGCLVLGQGSVDVFDHLLRRPGALGGRHQDPLLRVRFATEAAAREALRSALRWAAQPGARSRAWA